MRLGEGRMGNLCRAALIALMLQVPMAMAADADSNTKTAQGGIRFGMDREEYDAQARAAMQVDPVVAAHIGAIRKATLDEAASMDAPGPDVLVYDVEGNRGKGRVTARFITVSANAEALGPGTLVMADGTEHAIEGDADAVASEHDGHDHHEEVAAGEGEDIFIRQAREAAQRYPLVQQHVGQIESFTINAQETGAAPGINEFVFDVVGSKGRGRLQADFITVSAETERLGKGVLTLANGRRYPFEGEAPGPDEDDAASDDEGLGGLQDNIFTRQARAAVQRYPLVQQHIGDITAFDLDLMASGEAEGATEFVFDLKGSKGNGRILADFITVDADTERLGKGVLTLADGRTFPFEGETAPARSAADAIPATFATQDGIFVKQARVAMQANTTVRQHIGDLRQVVFDRETSWALAGDRYVFDLVGSKGSGRLEAEFITVDADTEALGDGELVMANGRKHTLSAQ